MTNAIEIMSKYGSNMSFKLFWLGLSSKICNVNVLNLSFCQLWYQLSCGHYIKGEQ